MRAIVLYLLSLLSIYAHPHFFVDAFIDIQKGKVNHRWVFDRMNSRILIFNFDTNKNSAFEKKEQLAFLAAHFEKLKNDNYNLFMEIDGNELVADPINVKVQIINKRVEVSFDLLINIRQSGVVCTIDPTLYYAYKLNNLKSIYNVEKQVSKHDYCLGVTK